MEVVYSILLSQLIMDFEACLEPVHAHLLNKNYEQTSHFHLTFYRLLWNPWFFAQNSCENNATDNKTFNHKSI